MNIRKSVATKARKMYEVGALHITMGTFLTKFVAFFGSIVVVRVLSKEDYGVMGYVENIYNYALVFAALGMSNAMLRYLVIADDDREKKQYYNYIVKRSILINTGISVILIIMSQIMPFPKNYSTSRYLIPVLALLLPFQDLLNDVLFAIRAFFKNRMYAYGAFLSSSALIAGRIIGAKVGGVDGVLWSRVLINVVFVIIGFFYVRAVLFQRERVPHLKKEKQKIVNQYSLQYMITNGFWAIFMLNDKILLGLLMNDPAGLADYNVASVLPGNIAIFATAIGTFVGPYYTKNEKNVEWVRRNYKKVSVISAAVVGSVALIIGMVASPLINIMYGSQYLNVVTLMRIMLVGAFFNSGLRYTTANILAAMGEIKYNMIISGIGIIIQVIMDFLLIPYMGVVAVALSNCVVFLLMAIALFFVFYRKYYMKKNSCISSMG